MKNTSYRWVECVWEIDGWDLGLQNNHYTGYLVFGITTLLCSTLISNTLTINARKYVRRYARFLLKDDVSSIDYKWPADVYSFGVTCFEILPGGVPFEGVSPGQIYDKIISGEKPRIHFGFPSRITQLINRCWATKPAQRPDFSQVCRELWVGLQASAIWVGSSCKKIGESNVHVTCPQVSSPLWSANLKPWKQVNLFKNSAIVIIVSTISIRLALQVELIMVSIFTSLWCFRKVYKFLRFMDYHNSLPGLTLIVGAHIMMYSSYKSVYQLLSCLNIESTLEIMGIS